MGLLSRSRDVPAPARPGPPRPDPERQCTGLTKRQTRCTGWTTSGSDRCTQHPARQTATAAVDALTASVALVELDGVGWQTWRPGSRAWQTEAWRLYDITGQMRFVANWVGNSCSRCRLYVAEVGPDGETAGETEDEDIAVLAAGPLGTGPAKDEALRLLGINLYVPGESYIVAEAEGGGRGEDAWWVVSGSQMRRTGDRVLIRRSLLHGGGDLLYRPGIDLILRVWTPHPADTDEPDSPTRSAIPDLREIEAIRKREFAELDSRLAGAGLLPLPQGIDFPRGDDDPPGLEGFYALLQRVMGTSLQNRSSAEALVPILMTVPPEAIDKIKLVTFWSELSDQLLPMREAAVKSLAQSLDVPPEILLGVGDVNHWCTTADTEIWTREGWKTYDQLAPGEDVLTLNHLEGRPQWQPCAAVNTWTVVAEPMVSMKGPAHSSMTTLAHRWPILADDRPTWTTSASLLTAAQTGTPSGWLLSPNWHTFLGLDLADLAITDALYTGTIWCPTTPNGTWLARHQGSLFYTGNSGWLVSEDAVTTQIVPVLSRIADALTTGYLRGALEAMGRDPADFTYAFDTSPLTTRANRVTDALQYHDKLLLSDVAAVESGAFRADQMPDEEEKKRRIVEAAIAGAPSLLGNPTLAGLIGIELPDGAVVAEPGQPPAGPVQEPAPAEDPKAIPAQPAENPDGGPDSSAALVAVAGLAVRRALTLAGTRLIPHTQRDRYQGTPRHELHVRRGPVSADMADHVLRGAWDDLPSAAEELHLDPAQLQGMLHGFAVELLTRGMAYEQQLLRDLVGAAMRGHRLDPTLALA